VKLIERSADATHILRATPATISVTFYGGSDTDTDTADPGVVTATITAANGTEVVTNAATQGAGAAARMLDLTATETANVDLWDVAWTSPTLGTVTTQVEIVGALLFTIPEARAFDKGQLGDSTKYPDAALASTRARILDEFERICRMAFVPRYRRLILDGEGGRQLRLWDTRVTKIREAGLRYRGQVTPTPLTTAELADLTLDYGGVVTRDSLGWWWPGDNNITIAYEYGYAQPPQAIRRAALILAVNQLKPTDLGDRTMSISSEAGTFRLATAGMGQGNWFGLPLVDSVLDQYRDPLFEVG